LYSLIFIILLKSHLEYWQINIKGFDPTERLKKIYNEMGVKGVKKSGVSYLHRTATTSYPCYVPVLGDLEGAGRTRLTPPQK